MASAVIHLAIAKVIEPYLNIKKKKDYYLGAIAPDISKHIGKTKQESHFLTRGEKKIPDLEKFKKKYPGFYQNDFDLGYYIHLFTDKLWSEDFLSKLIKNNSVKLKDKSNKKAAKETNISRLYKPKH